MNAPDISDATPAATHARDMRASFKRNASVILTAVALISAGAKGFQYASNSGAEQATSAAAQTMLKGKVEEHGAKIEVLRAEMDVVKVQNQVSINDRAVLHQEQQAATTSINHALDQLSGKVDRLLERGSRDDNKP